MRASPVTFATSLRKEILWEKWRGKSNGVAAAVAIHREKPLPQTPEPTQRKTDPRDKKTDILDVA